tara:strand:- start:80 stop:544 length:465 start_codon:yes stop_codon:yes gene_type:complete
MSDLRQAAQQALEALEGADAVDTDMQAAITALKNALEQQVSEFAHAQEQQAEPLTELQKRYLESEKAFQQQAEPRTREGFNDWWDGDYDDSENPYEPDSAAYWAWAGWQAAQRQWVGLEAEDFAQIENDEFWQVGNHMAIAMAVEAKLKEKHSD